MPRCASHLQTLRELQSHSYLLWELSSFPSLMAASKRLLCLRNASQVFRPSHVQVLRTLQAQLDESDEVLHFQVCASLRQV